MFGVYPIFLKFSYPAGGGRTLGGIERAAREGNIELVSMLINEIEDIEERVQALQTVFRIGFLTHNAAILRYVFAGIQTPNLRVEAGEFAGLNLLWIAIQTRTTWLLDAILANPMLNPNATLHLGGAVLAPIHLTVGMEYQEGVELLIADERVDLSITIENRGPDDRRFDGMTALQVAEDLEYTEIAGLLRRAQQERDRLLERERAIQRSTLAEMEAAGELAARRVLAIEREHQRHLDNLRRFGCLRTAALEGSLARVMRILANPYIDPRELCAEAYDRVGNAIHMAAEREHKEIVRFLLDDQRIDPNAQDSKGRTPLFLAASVGCQDIVRLLMGDPRVVESLNRQDRTGRTPLQEASISGHTEVVRALLEDERVMFNVQDFEEGRTPLQWAAAKGHVDIVELFLRDGRTQLNVPDEDFGMTSIHLAVLGGNKDVVELLLADQRIDIIRRVQQGMFAGYTALQIAESMGFTEIAELLRVAQQERHPEEPYVTPIPDAVEARYGPLRTAVIREDLERVRQLLGDPEIDHEELGIERYGGEGGVLHIAAKSRREAIVRVLLGDQRIDPNASDTRGNTPLSIAAYNGCQDIVRLLINDPRVDPNKRDRQMSTDSGKTPLQIASIRGHTAVVRTLLESERTVFDVLLDDDGRNPLHCAAKEGHAEIVELFLNDERTQFNLPDLESGMTPIHLAVIGGHTDVVELLLADQRVDIAARVISQYGRFAEKTACEIAESLGHTQMVELFREREHQQQRREITVSPEVILTALDDEDRAEGIDRGL